MFGAITRHTFTSILVTFLTYYFSVVLFNGISVKQSNEIYVPSSVSLTGSFLIAMSFLITNGLGVEFAEMERAVVNTVLVQVILSRLLNPLHVTVTVRYCHLCW